MKPTLVYRPAPRTGKAPVIVEKGRKPSVVVEAEKQFKAVTKVDEPRVLKKVLTAAIIKATNPPATPARKKPKAEALKRPKRVKKADGFDRDKYQAEYMTHRRSADKAGFGKGPNYKTVGEYLAWKAGQRS